MNEPSWVSRTIVDAMHFDLLQQHGGLVGVRDENALESAIARPRMRWTYDHDSDLAALAAAYGFAVATSHVYSDGNKRIAFMTMLVFLGLNGLEIRAEEVEVVQLMREIASGAIDEPTIAAWVRTHVVPLERS